MLDGILREIKSAGVIDVAYTDDMVILVPGLCTSANTSVLGGALKIIHIRADACELSRIPTQ